MKHYTVIIEYGEPNLSAYVPDVPGCVAVGDTREEVLKNIQEALQFHIDGLREYGMPVPEPSTSAGSVEIQAA